MKSNAINGMNRKLEVVIVLSIHANPECSKSMKYVQACQRPFMVAVESLLPFVTGLVGAASSGKRLG